jgi:hypothetical protein
MGVQIGGQNEECLAVVDFYSNFITGIPEQELAVELGNLAR